MIPTRSLVDIVEGMRDAHGQLVWRVTEFDAELLATLDQFVYDPLGFVLFAFDWDNDPSLQVVELPPEYQLAYGRKYGPDKWACDLLTRIGEKCETNAFNGRDPVTPIREAVVSGHGIGKSAMVGWLVCWIMSTRPNAIGTVTATTNGQLRSKTWAQIAHWHSKCITRSWFHITTSLGAMRMEHKAAPVSWFVQAQSCDESNSEAFAGQHNVSSTSFYIFDEASGVPDAIDTVSEGGLTDGEPMKFAFGNPTQNIGWFRECFRKFKHRWGNTHVDSREAQITNKKQIAEWIDDHGLDSDFVKVRVRGMFPAQSAKQFISSEDVDRAYGKPLSVDAYQFAPKILICDPAWTGDDALVISIRQGLYFNVLRSIPKNDNDFEIAQLLVVLEDEHQVDAVLIDMGYGTGIYSAGKTMGREWILLNFASASPDPGYLNLRAYGWGQVKKWLKEGGAIPKRQTLYDDLTGIQAKPRPDGKIVLESKEDMKTRGVSSPNEGDTLAMSLMVNVKHKDRSKQLAQHRPRSPMAEMNYNPADAAAKGLRDRSW